MTALSSRLPKILEPVGGGNSAEQWRYANAQRLERFQFAPPMQGGLLPQRKSTGHALIAQDGRWQDISLPEGCTLKINGTLAVLTLADYADLELELVSSLSHAVSPVAAQMQLDIHIGQDASLRLLDWSVSSGVKIDPALQMLNLNLHLANNATVRHVRLTNLPDGDFVFTKTNVDVNADAHYHYFAFVKGGQQSRHQLTVCLKEEGACATLGGAYQLKDSQIAEHALLIEHQAPRTNSNQHFRGVVDGEARGVFQGKVHVHQVAQETDAQQLHKALLLSPRAEVDAKPELEIYADNVKCSHGATVGALDDNALFYLRARGIDETVARQMLTDAFIAAVISEAPCFQEIIAAEAGIDAAG